MSASSSYLRYFSRTSRTDNPNTPDILHEFLQTGGRTAFMSRLILAATLSSSYGIYSGFELCENVSKQKGSEEYLNSEKYQYKVWDWDRPGNIRGMERQGVYD